MDESERLQRYRTEGELEASAGEDSARIIWLVALSIPLVAVGIPFLGVAGSMGLGGIVLGAAATVVVLSVAANLARGLLRLRHRQRVEELRLQLELSRQDAARLAEVNRLVD